MGTLLDFNLRKKHQAKRKSINWTFFHQVDSVQCDGEVRLQAPLQATIVVSQPSNVVVIQPGRKLPGRWSTGLLFNDPCCLACLFPCLHYVWAIQIGRKAGLPGFCETQVGCPHGNVLVLKSGSSQELGYFLCLIEILIPDTKSKF